LIFLDLRFPGIGIDLALSFSTIPSNSKGGISMKAYSDKDIAKLNDFLKNEIAAVETYGQCIAKSDRFPTLERLIELRQSHAERASLLKERIVALGGKPAEGAGVWGGVAKLVEGGAKAFGEKAALSALEEGEDKGLKDYNTEIDDLSDSSRQFVASMILPEQQRSHDALSRMLR
jgi:demethoxyubiquinone hydroxylase (CLK1/Coq7/Cat5 family)